VNPLRGSRYDVFLPGYPDLGTATCTCTDFTSRGLGTCKHLEAVRLWLNEHRADVEGRPTAGSGDPLDGAALWRSVDERMAELRRGTAPLGQRARKVGSVLYRRSAA
jgi:uncharacterized Zn finger protein